MPKFTVNVAINGFGRIGRQALRIIEDKHPELNVVLINDLTDGETLAHLFMFDSTYGAYNGKAEFKNNRLITAQDEIRTTAEKDPANLPLKEMKVDLVLECSGHFTKREDAALHLKAGARKVIISAPCKDKADATICMGVNEDVYDPETMHVLSNASCTTNCLAPMAKVLNDAFGIERGFMTTIHSYTNDQNLLDLPHRDLRRARSAGVNIVPTSTGAAKAIGLVIPELEGKLNGIAVRVPTPAGSITDLTVLTKKQTSAEEVNEAFKKAAVKRMKGFLRVEERPLVLKDFVGDPSSCILDAALTEVNGGNLVKTFAWYDNEWGYSNRLIDLVMYVGAKL